MTLLIGFFLLSIVFSFLCSIWEAVLLSVTHSYIKRKEQDDPVTGKLLSGLKKNIDRPLSAILTLNTIAHTVGAIGVGAQAGKLFGTRTVDLFGFELAYESIIATMMTLGILFLSEIIPKSIGANNWKGLAPFTARSLKALLFLLAPFVWLSGRLTKMIKKDKRKSVFSKQDFAAMTDLVGESGEIGEREYKLIKNVLQFDELTAKDVMTPRPVVFMAEESQSLQSFYDANKPVRFSRIPLYGESKDQVTGLLLKSELLRCIVEGKGEETLAKHKRPISIISPDMKLQKVFEKLNGDRAHLAVVMDEFGGLAGLVSLEDVIETLFGLEIMDENDSISDLQAHARQKWEERAKKLGII